jgi:hypothetical protein
VAHNGMHGFDYAVRTPAEAERSRNMHDAERAIRRGDNPDLSGFDPRDRRTIKLQARYPVPEHRFKSLSIRDKLRAYDMATPEERKKYHLTHYLAGYNPRNTVAFRTAPPEVRKQIINRLREIRQSQ